MGAKRTYQRWHHTPAMVPPLMQPMRSDRRSWGHRELSNTRQRGQGRLGPLVSREEHETATRLQASTAQKLQRTDLTQSMTACRLASTPPVAPAVVIGPPRRLRLATRVEVPGEPCIRPLRTTGTDACEIRPCLGDTSTRCPAPCRVCATRRLPPAWPPPPAQPA